MKNKSSEGKGIKEIKFLYIDFMRDIAFPFYHKWIIHKGKMPNWLLPEKHINPWYILTPRLLKRQCNNILKNNL
jgi:hypothetical protein